MACVATAPTPVRAQGTIGPTENQCDWTAVAELAGARVAGDDRVGALAGANGGEGSGGDRREDTRPVSPRARPVSPRACG